MRNYILLTLAVLAGFVAFFLSKSQLESEYERLQLNARKVKVIAPKHDMVEGDIITPADLTIRRIFAADVSGDEVQLEDVRQIVDQKLAFSVKQNVPFRWQDFALPDLARGGSLLSRRIPDGDRALSIAVDNVSSVSSMIRPNDRVDIIGTFRFPQGTDGQLEQVTLTLMQNITVLAVGQQMSSDEGPGSGRPGRTSYSTITLSVSQEKAEMLVFAQSQGQLTMTLRASTDVRIEEDLAEVDFNLLKEQARQYNRQAP